VIAALETHGLAVATATVARPSLDDVYLRHAGRAWKDNENQEVAA
jgi:ABC-2 type transport system ATP-binding protein